jgi:hypothetical protein
MSSARSDEILGEPENTILAVPVTEAEAAAQRVAVR